MSGFGDYFHDQEYQKIVGLGNKLGEIRYIIDRSSGSYTKSGVNQNRI
jgi:altronate dehydratase